jgi:predicted ATPase
MGDLNSRLQQAKGIQLAIRVGVHTGLVVIGEMGGAGRQEQLALGETPNIAARIEGLAEPNTIAMSEATYRLVQGYFECQDLGAQTLRGVLEPLQVYRVLSESGVYSRLDVAQTRGLTPLVGRESEVTLLLERWEQAKGGHGQVVLLSGEAGIGKSRLVQVLKEHVAHEPHMRWECRSAEYSQNTALFPLVELFQRILQFETGDTSDEKFGKLERMLSQYRLPLGESVPLFAPLLSLFLPENHYPQLNLSPQRMRQRTLEAIVATMLELAERQPVLFILEDLHWTDPTTLEFLNLVIEQIPTTSMLTVLTCRPTFQPSWSHRSYLSEITVNRLSREQIERVAAHVAGGKRLPAEVLQQIVEKTDGVPLFVEELTKALLESGHLKDVDGHYELVGSFSTFAIPATLQDSLMARLDRLVTAKAVAQYAAVIGRQFSYALLQVVSQLDEAMLQHELGRLVEAEIVYQRGLPPQASYLFKHALIQDAAYQSLLKSTRQQYHQRIAQVLEAQFPETAEAEPELLTHHHTEAGLAEQAVGCWQRAGERSNARSAYAEAVAHLTQGLEVLKSLPETSARAQHELLLLTTLGPAVGASKGHGAPETEAVYSRALALCQQVGETPQLFVALMGLWQFALVRAQHQTARALGERLLSLAQSVGAPILLVQAHRALGEALQNLGELLPAQQHLAQASALYDPQHHYARAVLSDPGVYGLSFVAWVLWLLGYPEQALQRSQAALALARALSHPQSLASALVFAAMLHQCRRERHRVQDRAEAAITLAREQGLPHQVAYGSILRGWALAMQGQWEQGMAQTQQGLGAQQAVGAQIARPHFLALLTEAHAAAGQAEAGLEALTEALALVDHTEERYWEAELYRLKGELLLQQGIPHAPQAEACFQQALAVARRQQAKSWELRAAMSLARLWQQQGQRAEARELLAPVYDWFTEGFDTADLQEAKALLDTLSSTWII